LLKPIQTGISLSHCLIRPRKNGESGLILQALCACKISSLNEDCTSEMLPNPFSPKLNNLTMNWMAQLNLTPTVSPTVSAAIALLSALMAIAPFSDRSNAQTLTIPQGEPVCQGAALSRMTRHRVVAGETVAAIAQKYGLIPATIMGFNPSAQASGALAAGTELQIPPYNGIRAEVPAGSDWRDISAAYNVRADVLFEVNGCVADAPRVVFIPGINWSPTNRSTATTEDRIPVTRYPLPATANILAGYGYQLNSAGSSQVEFNSGVDLDAAKGTQVLASGAGTVAFAGQQGSYGNLIVINHNAGFQTRYAHLDTMTVKVGQKVNAGDRLGTVGATGRVSSPRLHFEVRLNSNAGWVAADPGDYFEQLRVVRNPQGREPQNPTPGQPQTQASPTPQR
jgi:murein DD-endopeptidase MepM/ murein hydrolase activator NlpD